MLVTGSARLDFYRYSSDSLQGRYHLLRLHPGDVPAGVVGEADKNNSDPILSVQLPGRRPILLVETKLGDAPLDPSLRYLRASFPRTDGR